MTEHRRPFDAHRRVQIIEQSRIVPLKENGNGTVEFSLERGFPVAIGPKGSALRPTADTTLLIPGTNEFQNIDSTTILYFRPPFLDERLTPRQNASRQPIPTESQDGAFAIVFNVRRLYQSGDTEAYEQSERYDYDDRGRHSVQVHIDENAGEVNQLPVVHAGIVEFKPQETFFTADLGGSAGALSIETQKPPGAQIQVLFREEPVINANGKVVRRHAWVTVIDKSKPADEQRKETPFDLNTPLIIGEGAPAIGGNPGFVDIPGCPLILLQFSGGVEYVVCSAVPDQAQTGFDTFIHIKQNRSAGMETSLDPVRHAPTPIASPDPAGGRAALEAAAGQIQAPKGPVVRDEHGNEFIDELAEAGVPLAGPSAIQEDAQPPLPPSQPEQRELPKLIDIAKPIFKELKPGDAVQLDTDHVFIQTSNQKGKTEQSVVVFLDHPPSDIEDAELWIGNARGSEETFAVPIKARVRKGLNVYNQRVTIGAGETKWPEKKGAGAAFMGALGRTIKGIPTEQVHLNERVVIGRTATCTDSEKGSASITVTETGEIVVENDKDSERYYAVAPVINKAGFTYNIPPEATVFLPDELFAQGVNVEVIINGKTYQITRKTTDDVIVREVPETKNSQVTATSKNSRHRFTDFGQHQSRNRNMPWDIHQRAKITKEAEHLPREACIRLTAKGMLIYNTFIPQYHSDEPPWHGTGYIQIKTSKQP